MTSPVNLTSPASDLHELREALDMAAEHVLPWDIELVIDEPDPEPESEAQGTEGH